MTSLQLLAWIVGGIALQLAVYLAIAFFRHWQGYEALQQVVDDNGLGVAAVESQPEPVQASSAWSGFRTFQVTHRQIENGNADICSFHLRPTEPFDLPAFRPGQFLTFKLEVPRADSSVESIVRCYSLSDAPGKDHYRVSIKRVPAPPHSALPPGRASNYFHRHVEVGTQLQVRAPSGHFYLASDHSPVVLVAGGIGITPMLSMLNWCAEHQAQREVWLFYGVRNLAEVAMLDHLRSIAGAHPHFKLHFCFSEPLPAEAADGGLRTENWAFHPSRVDVPLLRSLLPLKPYHFYICGPTAMLQSLVPALDEWGVPDAHIHFEAFGPASIPRKKQSTPSEPLPAVAAVHVAFKKTGKRMAWDPACGSLLALAEANGISVDSGCRSGSCGSCMTQLIDGEVAYDHTPDFDLQPGACLLCVSKPRTDLVLDA